MSVCFMRNKNAHWQLAVLTTATQLLNCTGQPTAERDRQFVLVQWNLKFLFRSIELAKSFGGIQIYMPFNDGLFRCTLQIDERNIDNLKKKLYTNSVLPQSICRSCFIVLCLVWWINYTLVHRLLVYVAFAVNLQNDICFAASFEYIQHEYMYEVLCAASIGKLQKLLVFDYNYGWWKQKQTHYTHSKKKQ